MRVGLERERRMVLQVVAGVGAVVSGGRQRVGSEVCGVGVDVTVAVISVVDKMGINLGFCTVAGVIVVRAGLVLNSFLHESVGRSHRNVCESASIDTLLHGVGRIRR